MPKTKKRWHPEKRRRLDRQLLARDGDCCILCVAEGGEAGPIKDPTIDHLNNQKHDHRLVNLVRLCRGHNTAEGNRWRNGQARILTPDNISVYMNRTTETASAPAPGLPETAVDPSQVTPVCVSVCESERKGSGEAKAKTVPRIARATPDRSELDCDAEDAAVLQEMMNPLYRLWLFVHVYQQGSITREDALNGGAEYLDTQLGRGAQPTIGRYFKKTISITGWLEESRGEDSRKACVFRPKVDTRALYVLLYGRVLALNALLHGQPVNLKDLTIELEGGPA